VDDLQDQLRKAPERMNAVRSLFSLSLRSIIISGLRGELLPRMLWFGLGLLWILGLGLFETQ
jgi:hypothetical protein